MRPAQFMTQRVANWKGHVVAIWSIPIWAIAFGSPQAKHAYTKAPIQLWLPASIEVMP